MYLSHLRAHQIRRVCTAYMLAQMATRALSHQWSITKLRLDQILKAMGLANLQIMLQVTQKPRAGSYLQFVLNLGTTFSWLMEAKRTCCSCIIHQWQQHYWVQREAKGWFHRLGQLHHLQLITFNGPFFSSLYTLKPLQPTQSNNSWAQLQQLRMALDIVRLNLDRQVVVTMVL